VSDRTPMSEVYDLALVLWMRRGWIIALTLVAVVVAGGWTAAEIHRVGLAESSVRLWVAPSVSELTADRATSGELMRAAGIRDGRVYLRVRGKETRDLVLTQRDGVEAVILVNRLAALLLEDIDGAAMRAWERDATDAAVRPGVPMPERPRPTVRVTDRAVSATRTPVSLYAPVLGAAGTGLVLGILAALVAEATARERVRRRQGAV
jgi:uncharacterized protein involved in exopolysaccharide biosynthesis